MLSYSQYTAIELKGPFSELCEDTMIDSVESIVSGAVLKHNGSPVCHLGVLINLSNI